MIRIFNCIRSKGYLDAFGLIALHLRRPPDDATNSDHVLLAMPFYYYHYTTTNNVYMTTMVGAQYSTKSPSPENTLLLLLLLILLLSGEPRFSPWLYHLHISTLTNIYPTYLICLTLYHNTTSHTPQQTPKSPTKSIHSGRPLTHSAPSFMISVQQRQSVINKEEEHVCMNRGH